MNSSRHQVAFRSRNVPLYSSSRPVRIGVYVTCRSSAERIVVQALIFIFHAGSECRLLQVSLNPKFFDSPPFHSFSVFQYVKRCEAAQWAACARCVEAGRQAPGLAPLIRARDAVRPTLVKDPNPIPQSGPCLHRVQFASQRAPAACRAELTFTVRVLLAQAIDAFTG